MSLLQRFIESELEKSKNYREWALRITLKQYQGDKEIQEILADTMEKIDRNHTNILKELYEIS